MQERLRQNSGITLIALVVTIIVLLILAGISIGAITGNNGIINQAQNAKDDTQYAQWEEQIDVAIIDAESKNRDTTMDNVIEELKNKGVIDDASQVNKKTGAITTNEPSYIIEDKLNDYLEFGPGMIAGKNEEYTDDNGDTATIPKGFEILEEADTIDDGLVIQDEEGNQFVWIPVETPVSDTEANGTNNKAMAIKSGDNYKGLLYNFDVSTTLNTSTVKAGCTTTNVRNREPDIVNNEEIFTKEELQVEYDEMIKSVKKYHGFYVGRYELGLEGDKPVSKNANENDEVLTANQGSDCLNGWYGAYSKCKEFASKDSSKSVVSSMIWGSQYDAMLNWMIKEGENIISASDKWNDDLKKKRKNGITGSYSNDVIKNIYDLYGCKQESCLEAGKQFGSQASGRVYRSGTRINDEVGYRSYGIEPTKSNSAQNSRITLYIKI